MVELDIDRRYEEHGPRATPRPPAAAHRPQGHVPGGRPGNGQRLPRDGRIGVEGTAPDVDPDEILAALDADTRPYLKLLVAGAGKGLRGRGERPERDARAARAAPPRPGPVTARHGPPPGRAQAPRAQLLPAHRRARPPPREIERLVERLAARCSARSRARTRRSRPPRRRLPGTLRHSAQTLEQVGGLRARAPADAGGPAPADPEARRDERRGAALLERDALALRDQIRPFVRAARPWTADLRGRPRGRGARGSRSHEALGKGNRFFNIGAYNPGGAEGLAGKTVTEQRARAGGLPLLARLDLAERRLAVQHGRRRRGRGGG